MDFKKTLNMPKTDFEMRGNLVQKDKIFLTFWDRKDLYKIVSERKSKKFILHDGPPYANGDIHLGHALNKTLKDIIVKDRILRGDKISFIPGWDTHGLPIELQVQKSGIEFSNVDKNSYLKSCYKYAYKQIEKQEKQFKKLGVIADYKNKYLTLNKLYEKSEIQVFFKMLNNKLVYRDLKPIYWSWSSQTALADTEIEYKNIVDPAVYVKFKIDNYYILIWTTTPWTLPANVALAFGKDIEYIVAKDQNTNEEFIIAKNLFEKIKQKTNKNLLEIRKIDINSLINRDAINPLNLRKSKIVWGHHVTTEDGTGIVHTAGGHGTDDYIIVKENNLDLIVVVDEKGNMMNADKYNDLFYLDANREIVRDLNNTNNLFHFEEFDHSVPIDWRTKKPVIYRATKQWFFSVNKIKKNLINLIPNVKWNPSWGGDRLKKMIENRDDWCISRQRIWGVSIPVIYDEKNNVIINKKLQKNIIDLFEERGILGWHSIEIEDILPKEIKFNKLMKKEMDTLDVWFDSGTSNNFILQNNEKADVYIEGTDQFRGWFNSSLITSYVSRKDAPYKKVITHGFVTDGNGNKMSKSIGNVISPFDIVDKFGIDILRIWIATSDYNNNIKISDEIIEQVKNDYKKIRNTIRFILGNISDYNQKNNKKTEFSLISKIVLSKIFKNFEIIKNNFENNVYHQNIKIILNDITTGFISYYLEYSKDIVYIEKKESEKRKEVQYVLNEILKFLLYSLASIMPVTIEEAFQIYSNKKDLSIFETVYPNFKDYKNEKLWENLNLIRSEVNKKIEEFRNNKIIKRSVESEATLFVDDNNFDLFKNEELADLLFLGKVNLKNGDELKVELKKFNGKKCDRCWKYYDEKDFYSNIDDNICSKCDKILR